MADKILTGSVGDVRWHDNGDGTYSEQVYVDPLQLDTVNDSISTYEKGYTYTNLTASGQVSGAACVVAGVLCTASSSGTLTLYDNTTATGTIVGFNGATLTANTFYPLPRPIIFTTGCYATIGGTSATIQVLTRVLSK